MNHHIFLKKRVLIVLICCFITSSFFTLNVSHVSAQDCTIWDADNDNKVSLPDVINILRILATTNQNGQFCSDSAECPSGYCVDGVCCNSSCNSTCYSCLATDTGGIDGTCGIVTNGTSCDDGLFCNGNETCVEGSCSNSTGDPCPGPGGDGNCNESCDETTDSCTATDPDGTSCNDGLTCTDTDTCISGVCQGSLNCPTLECEIATCNAEGGCDVDLNAGWCKIDGACYTDNEVNLPDNYCQICDAAGDPTSWTNVNGSCDDQNACTYNDTCSEGMCTGDVYSCDDGNPSTVDTCNGDGTCTNI